MIQRTVWQFLKKLGIKPPYDPARYILLGLPLLGIYPEETKIEKDTCNPMFTATLFTIARTWKQPRCSLTDKQIKKLWYIHTMEYHPAIKRKASVSVLMRWMNLEPIIQREVSQKEKNNYRTLMHTPGTPRDGTDEPLCRAAVEAQTLRTGPCTQEGREREGGGQRLTGKHTSPRVKQIDSENVLCDSGAQSGHSNHLEGSGRERGGRAAQGRGDMGKPMADSCLAETNATL